MKVTSVEYKDGGSRTETVRTDGNEGNGKAVRLYLNSDGNSAPDEDGSIRYYYTVHPWDDTPWANGSLTVTHPEEGAPYWRYLGEGEDVVDGDGDTEAAEAGIAAYYAGKGIAVCF
jgi:hypothetical protein